MPKIKFKVLAYITSHHHLLVFRHPYARQAGIQVPAGTIEEHETPEQAVLREAHEETGLTDLTIACFLGENERDMSDFGRDEIHHRYFYHLHYYGDPISTWRHEERYHSSGPTLMPVIFEFFWAPFPHGVPSLIADHDAMFPQLAALLSP